MSKLFRLLLCLLVTTPHWAYAAPTVSGSKPHVGKSTVPKTSKPVKTTVTPPPANDTSRLGYLLMDQESGRVLEAFQERESFIPASVSKVPTTLAALHILGSNHRYRTTVQGTGPVVDGVVQGDLILAGSGDPSFNVAGVMDLILQLRLKGIRRVQGRFLYDESALIPEGGISNEQNDEETYNQGVSALSMEFNRAQLQWSLVQGQLIARVTPDLDGYITLQLGDASRAGPSLTYLGGDKVERWRLNPRNARSGWEWVPIKKPARFTALFFRALGRQAGIELPIPDAGATPTTAVTLASHASPP
ncbi:MAG: D-alanyl-D-alanine carboxypeptidase [Magnetococcales bacterium]|nr:D-alanyl-D-alanine carboxypeptidase [Magnetococcales bacterium]